MTFGSAVVVVLALGIVLSLLGFSARLLRRYAGGLSMGGNQLPLEVVQRLAIGPKQGIALVRVGERVIAVSMGEGGIRRLMELPEEECAVLTAARTSATVPPLPITPANIRGFIQKVTRPAAMANASPAGSHTAPANLRGLIQKVMRSAATFALAAFVIGAGATSLSAQTATAPAGTPSATTQPPATQPTATAPAAARVSSPAVSPAAVNALDNAIPKLAPQIDLRLGDQAEGGLRLSGTVGVVIMMGLLTMLPTLILSMTSFTRILIVLHFLRQAIGTQSAPPGHLVAALAMLLTGFVMAPTLKQVNETALQPWMNGQMTQGEMMVTGAKPFRTFMLGEVRERDLAVFMDLSETPSVRSTDEIPLVVLVSAFVTSELRTAFQIGFALFLPFIIIDIVVASVLMSMGMFMLPPAMIALPFKLLLFVLVDGWTLVVQGLITSFN